MPTFGHTKYRAILITGGAGFIGSHVVDAFAKAITDKQLSAQQIVVGDVFDYCASAENLTEAISSGNVTVVKMDICDSQAVTQVFKDYNIDAVVHLAAQSHVDHSFGNSLTFTDVNVRGTHTLLEVAQTQWKGKNMHSKRFLHVSTDEVYGSCEETEHCESTSLLQPTNPYAASKAAAEMFVYSYHRSFDLPTVVARSNNVYGPRQYPEKVIPKFILRLLSGLAPRLQGDGTQKRSFLFATDAADAFLKLFMSGQVGRVYNIGSENELSIVELARLLSKRLQPNLSVESFSQDADRPFNDRRYHVSTDRIEKDLQWSPTVSLEDGLKRTIDWYTKLDCRVYWKTLPEDLFISHEV